MQRPVHIEQVFLLLKTSYLSKGCTISEAIGMDIPLRLDVFLIHTTIGIYIVENSPIRKFLRF